MPDFQEADDMQLREIAYHDNETSWILKVAAEAELIKRQGGWAKDEASEGTTSLGDR